MCIRDRPYIPDSNPFRLFLRKTPPDLLQAFLFHTHSIVANPYPYIIPRLSDIQNKGSPFFLGLQAMDYRIFHKGLQGKPGKRHSLFQLPVMPDIHVQPG